MKKDSSLQKRQKQTTKESEANAAALLLRGNGEAQKLWIGFDVGDRRSHVCVLNEQGEVVARDVVETDRECLTLVFGKLPASVVALEVGTHSRWISRL